MHWLIIFGISLFVLGPVGTIALAIYFGIVWMAVHSPLLAGIIAIFTVLMYLNSRKSN